MTNRTLDVLAAVQLFTIVGSFVGLFFVTSPAAVVTLAFTLTLSPFIFAYQPE